MKKFYLVSCVLLLFLVPAQAQKNWVDKKNLSGEFFNFHCSNNNVYWQKIYDNIPAEDSSFVRNFFYENTKIEMQGRTGVARKVVFDYRKAGISRMSASGVLNWPCTIEFIVDIKEQKYRVTVIDLNFHNSSNFFGANENAVLTLHDAAFRGKNGKIKLDFIDIYAEQFNAVLSMFFDYKANNVPVELNDEW